MIFEPSMCTVPEEFLTLCGVELMPCSEQMACGVAMRGTARFGVRAITDDDGMHLLVSPNVRIPDIGTARADLLRWQYEQENDLIADLCVDDRDGEVYLLIDAPGNAEEAERALAPYLDRAEEINEAIRTYVATHIERVRKEVA